MGSQNAQAPEYHISSFYNNVQPLNGKFPLKVRPTGELELRTTHSGGVGCQEAGGGGGIIEGGEIVGGTADWGDTGASPGALGHCPGGHCPPHQQQEYHSHPPLIQ